MIVCAGDKESFDFAVPIGIGLINSSINLTKSCMLNPPNFLFFVGTAGSYGEREIFDVVTSSKSSNVEIGYFEKNSYTPISNIITDETSHVSRETCDNIINSSNYITKNQKISNQFLKAGFSLENMEFFAVASVAKSFNIPFRGVFCVTNYCNKNAHDDFINNHKKAMEILNSFIKKEYHRLLEQ